MSDTVATAGDILQACASVFGVSAAELTGPARTVPLVHYRQASMLAMRRLTGASYPSIGRAFRRGHDTVMHGCRRARPELVSAVISELTEPSALDLLRAEVAALRAEVDGLLGRPGAGGAAGQLRPAGHG